MTRRPWITGRSRVPLGALGRESNWEDSRGRIVWVFVAASGLWIRQIEYR